MSETIKVRAAVGLYQVGGKWQAVVQGYEVQADAEDQARLDNELLGELDELAHLVSVAEPEAHYYIEVEIPLPVEVEKPVIMAEVVDD